VAKNPKDSGRNLRNAFCGELSGDLDFRTHLGINVVTRIAAENRSDERQELNIVVGSKSKDCMAMPKLAIQNSRLVAQGRAGNLG
jgi:citrate lyase beta subunit